MIFPFIFFYYHQIIFEPFSFLFYFFSVWSHLCCTAQPVPFYPTYIKKVSWPDLIKDHHARTIYLIIRYMKECTNKSCVSFCVLMYMCVCMCSCYYPLVHAKDHREYYHCYIHLNYSNMNHPLIFSLYLMPQSAIAHTNSLTHTMNVLFVIKVWYIM